jgi:hypothetical protein
MSLLKVESAEYQLPEGSAEVGTEVILVVTTVLDTVDVLWLVFLLQEGQGEQDPGGAATK